jgi:hypothetical protein
VRLWVRPLPAIQLLTGCLITRSTGRTVLWISLVRTCSGAGQILLLAGLLAVGLGVARRRKGLPVGTVHWRRLSNAPPDSVGGDKGLRLRGDGRENAVLVKAHAVLAAPVLGGLEARAANLEIVSGEPQGAITRALPCDGGSTGRQLQCADAGRAAGGAAARTAVAAAVHGTDLAGGGRGSTRWGLGGGRTVAAAAAAGTGRAAGQPCRVAALEGEEGASCSSGRRQVSAGDQLTQHAARNGADLHVRAADRSRWRAAARWAAASGRAAGLGHPGAETWSSAERKSG